MSISIPFALDQSPRRAIESALDALSAVSCPSHPDEILRLDRERSLRQFGRFELCAFTEPNEMRNWTLRRGWSSGATMPPIAWLSINPDLSPAAVLADWRTTLDAEHAPHATIRLEGGGDHYHFSPDYERCPACAAARAVAAVGVPPIWQDASFANFSERGGALPAHLAKCKAFAESPRGTLLLLGKVGGGKSHLAAAIARAVVYRMKTLFISHESLLERHRRRYEEFDPAAPPKDIIGDCRAAELLILDDLGRRQAGRDEEGILHAVLNVRYEHRLPTVLTGNLDRAGLQQVIGDALFDRLAQTCFAHLAFNVSSYRSEARASYLAAAPAPPPPAKTSMSSEEESWDAS